jgi:hypothetical protein
MIEVQAPNKFKVKMAHWTVFLAGSIEMGAAVKWQNEAVEQLKPYNDELVLFNPRRDDWDSSWVQSIDNPQFAEQVNWEIEHITKSDIVFFYFAGDTKSPITLMELGIIAGMHMRYATSDVIVVCEPNFWRKGNVDILCDTINVPLYDNLKDGLSHLENYLVTNGGFIPGA